MTVHHIGEDRWPVLVIDTFLEDPGVLAQAAQRAAFSERVRFYPGLQAPFSFHKMEAVLAPHADLIADTFAMPQGASITECGLAIVCTPPDQLAPPQCIPHIDTTVEDRLAVLVYLSGMQFGGTGFFRHRSTGFEAVGPDRLSAYDAALDRDVAAHGPPEQAYITGDTSLFELIGRVDAAPGRAVIYKSNALHSGLIRNVNALSADPAKGRLTLNAFLTANPG